MLICSSWNIKYKNLVTSYGQTNKFLNKTAFYSALPHNLLFAQPCKNNLRTQKEVSVKKQLNIVMHHFKTAAICSVKLSKGNKIGNKAEAHEFKLKRVAYCTVQTGIKMSQGFQYKLVGLYLSLVALAKPNFVTALRRSLKQRKECHRFFQVIQGLLYTRTVFLPKQLAKTNPKIDKF